MNLFHRERRQTDVDALILYEDGVDEAALIRAAGELTKQGVSVRLERTVPEELRYGRLYRFQAGALTEVTDNA